MYLGCSNWARRDWLALESLTTELYICVGLCECVVCVRQHAEVGCHETPPLLILMQAHQAVSTRDPCRLFQWLLAHSTCALRALIYPAQDLLVCQRSVRHARCSSAMLACLQTLLYSQAKSTEGGETRVPRPMCSYDARCNVLLLWQ